MYIKEITDEHIGKEISCIIEKTIIKKGEITKEGRYFYILQNDKQGTSASNLKGYKGSWVIDYGTESDLKTYYITKIKLLNHQNIYELW